MQSKEEDVSVLEQQARQILTEGSHNDRARALRQEMQSIKSNVAMLLQRASDQISRIREAASNSRSIVLEIQQTIESFERKEMLIGRRLLPIDADSVDDEISRITSLHRQIDAEADAVIMKIDEQKRLHAEVSGDIPAEVQAVSELQNVKERILVRLTDHSYNTLFPHLLNL